VVVVCNALVGSKTDKGLLYVLVFFRFCKRSFLSFPHKGRHNQWMHGRPGVTRTGVRPSLRQRMWGWCTSLYSLHWSLYLSTMWLWRLVNGTGEWWLCLCRLLLQQCSLFLRELSLAHSACSQTTSNTWWRCQKLPTSYVPVTKARRHSVRWLSLTLRQRLWEKASWYRWQPAVRNRRSRTDSSEEFRKRFEFQVIQATVSTLPCGIVARPILSPYHWRTWCLCRNSWLPLLRSRWSGG